jgi:hypothetical protein
LQKNRTTRPPVVNRTHIVKQLYSNKWLEARWRRGGDEVEMSVVCSLSRWHVSSGHIV